MKTSFTTFICSLSVAAAASTGGLRLVEDPNPAVVTDTTSFTTYIDGLRLRQDGASMETADTLMNVFANCPKEVAQFESCYEDKATFMECANCAWIDTLSETSVVCDGLQAVLEDDAAKCDSCLNEREMKNSRLRSLHVQ